MKTRGHEDKKRLPSLRTLLPSAFIYTILFPLSKKIYAIVKEDILS